MRFLHKAALATMIALAPCAASANTFFCQMSTMGASGNWIPDTFSVVFYGEGAVINFGQSAFQGQVVRNNTAGFTLVTTIETSSNTNQSARMRYSITYNTRTTVVRVRAQPLGYPNSFSGRGNCAQQS